MLRLVQLTDTHLYDTPDGRFGGVDTRASLAAVLAAVAREAPPPHLLVATGDLAMDGSAGAYRQLAAQLAPWPAALCLPGNHDEPAVLAAVAPELGRALPCCLALGAWDLVGLDSRVPGQPGGALGTAQLAWLDHTLGAGPGRPCAIFLHHPPVPVGSPWMDAMGLADAADLWRVLSAHARVRFVACGHVHQVFDTRHGAVRVLATPSTCVQFAPRAMRYSVDARAPGYRVFELAGDGRFATRVERVGAPLVAVSRGRHAGR